MRSDGYGVVYTPRMLANFTAKLLLSETDRAFLSPDQAAAVWDPACGEGILLEEFSREFSLHYENMLHCMGTDIEENVVARNKEVFSDALFRFMCKNTIIPSDKMTATNYWQHQLPTLPFVIANPPWSSEKVFTKDELSQAGYQLYSGQYDSYVLFIELCLKLVQKDGMLAFIIPDSLFSGENRTLRECLVKNTQIRIIARLGEKLFPDVSRATSIIILKNSEPTPESITRCYRLDTAERRDFLSGSLDIFASFQQKHHCVQQKRFEENQNYIFDIDAREEEECLLRKIARDRIDWNTLFRFGRGVEISKSGVVVRCERCGSIQCYSKKQLDMGYKTCRACGETTAVTASNVFEIISTSEKDGYLPLYVGENIHRYRFDGIRYIRPNVDGINYKSAELYEPPKILIRKTGLGIYACIDYASTYTSQTVYSCNYLHADESVPLEYYLGVLNSRVMYYYYLKKYGENEWKSHPYLTKDIIFSLPIRKADDANMAICRKIAQAVQKIQTCYSRRLDLEIEKLVLELYDIRQEEFSLIAEELNNLPDLNAVNQMKIASGELYV